MSENRLNSQYPQGNLELLRLFRERPFDSARAEELVRSIEDINAPVPDEKGFSKTYLYQAVEESNPEAVELLFRYGADPNTNNPDLIGGFTMHDF